MATLCITTENIMVHRQGHALSAKTDENASFPTSLFDIAGREFFPAHDVKDLILIGNASLTSQAVGLCQQYGINVAWINAGGRLRARLQNAPSASVTTRQGQYQRCADPTFTLKTAKAIVAAKINNQIATMLTRRKTHAPTDQIPILRAMRRRLTQCHNLNQVRGCEGMASRAYFTHFRQLVNQPFTFEGRKSRPAPDPTNSLLSFAYTMLNLRMHALIEALGFDAYFGFLHDLKDGRASLSLDLIEEFRAPVADRLVLRMLNRKRLVPENFTMTEDGVRLDEEGRKIFFNDWFEFFNSPIRTFRGSKFKTVSEAMLASIENIGRTIRHNVPYIPFSFGSEAT